MKINNVPLPLLTVTERVSSAQPATTSQPSADQFELNAEKPSMFPKLLKGAAGGLLMTAPVTATAILAHAHFGTLATVGLTCVAGVATAVAAQAVRGKGVTGSNLLNGVSMGIGYANLALIASPTTALYGGLGIGAAIGLVVANDMAIKAG